MKKTPAKGHTHKHAGNHHKHAGHHHKHHPAHHPKPATAHGQHVHAVAKHPHHAKARGLALDGLPVCAAQALAASLRLAGQSVSDDEIAQLWELTGADRDGASIAATLQAAARFGLAGCRPADSRPLGGFGLYPAAASSAQAARLGGLLQAYGAGLILGVELPGAHTVLATAAGWWSWGQLHDPAQFAHARIEECWAVSWS